MNRFTTLASTLLLATLMGACSSTPRGNHYVLSAPVAAVPSGNTPALGVGPIEIPEYLKRNGLVYNRQGNQVQVSETERWAEPLESGISRVMTMNLASLLGTQDVRPFPWHPQRPPDYGIKLRVITLNADDREARLVAEWLVFQAGSGEPVARRLSDLRQPMGTGELALEAVPAAYSALFYQLAEVIAEAIRSTGAN